MCFLFLTSCGGSESSTSKAPLPTSISFDVTPQQIEVGQSVTITWEAENVGKFEGEVVCNFGSKPSASSKKVVNPSSCIGSKEERPAESTQYTFGALRNDGSNDFITQTKEVVVKTVTVTTPPITNPAPNLSELVLQKVITGHNNLPHAVTIEVNPSNTILASTGHDHNIVFWRVSDGGQVRTLMGHTDIVLGLSFSPDGSTLASTGRDKTVKFWRVSDGSLLRSISAAHSDDITAVDFSPDGSNVVTSSFDNTVKLWSVSSGSSLQTMNHPKQVQDVVYGPNGNIATSSYDTALRLWNPDNGQLLKTLNGHSDWVIRSSFNSDGSLVASASWDGTIKLWNTNSGALIHTFNSSGDKAQSAVFTPNSTMVVAGSLEGVVDIWQVSSKALLKTLTFRARTDPIVFTSDGKKMIVGAGPVNNGTISIYGTSNNSIIF